MDGWINWNIQAIGNLNWEKSLIQLRAATADGDRNDANRSYRCRRIAKLIRLADSWYPALFFSTTFNHTKIPLNVKNTTV